MVNNETLGYFIVRRESSTWFMSVCLNLKFKPDPNVWKSMLSLSALQLWGHDTPKILASRSQNPWTASQYSSLCPQGRTFSWPALASKQTTAGSVWVPGFRRSLSFIQRVAELIQIMVFWLAILKNIWLFGRALPTKNINGIPGPRIFHLRRSHVADLWSFEVNGLIGSLLNASSATPNASAATRSAPAYWNGSLCLRLWKAESPRG